MPGDTKKMLQTNAIQKVMSSVRARISPKKVKTNVKANLEGLYMQAPTAEAVSIVVSNQPVIPSSDPSNHAIITILQN